MFDRDIEELKKRIAQEEKLVERAPSPQVAINHFQLAMLYKAKLATLESSSPKGYARAG